MIINVHKRFDKHLRRLSPDHREQTKAALRRFAENPFDSSLRNHPLKGHLDGRRAFSVSSDIRVVFQEFDGYVVVLMLDVGTHDQVYR